MEQTIDGVQYESAPVFGCTDCIAYDSDCIAYDSNLCNKLYDGSGNNCKEIIWIKSEKQSTPNGIPTFTPEQVTYIQQVFQIDVSQEVLPVKDGFVKKGDMIWWLSLNGPEYVKAELDWDNIKKFPNAYSVKEPKYKIVYE